MKRTQFTIRGLLGATTLAALSLFWLINADLSMTSNCGGNNEATSNVRHVLMTLQVMAVESGVNELSLQALSAEQHKYLTDIIRTAGPGEARYFVYNGLIRLGVDQPEIIVICDRAFTNVPRYTFRRSPPTHAVGYSDGSTKLISEREFDEIDRSQFVAVDSFRATQAAAP